MGETRDRLKERFVTATIGTALVDIVPPTAIGGYKTVAVHVENSGGSSFNVGQVQVAPELDIASPEGVGTASTWWRIVDSATFGSLATGTGTTYRLTDNAYQYLRVRASVAAGSTNGTAWITGGGW